MSAHIAARRTCNKHWAGCRDAAHETGAITVWQTDLFSCLAHCCCCSWAGRLAVGLAAPPAGQILVFYTFIATAAARRLACAATASAWLRRGLLATLLSPPLVLHLFFLADSRSSTLSACFGCSHGSICPLSDRRSLCLQAPHGAVHHFCIRKVPGTMNAVNKRPPRAVTPAAPPYPPHPIPSPCSHSSPPHDRKLCLSKMNVAFVT